MSKMNILKQYELIKNDIEGKGIVWIIEHITKKLNINKLELVSTFLLNIASKYTQK